MKCNNYLYQNLNKYLVILIIMRKVDQILHELIIIKLLNISQVH